MFVGKQLRILESAGRCRSWQLGDVSSSCRMPEAKSRSLVYSYLARFEGRRGDRDQTVLDRIWLWLDTAFLPRQSRTDVSTTTNKKTNNKNHKTTTTKQKNQTQS